MIINRITISFVAVEKHYHCFSLCCVLFEMFPPFFFLSFFLSFLLPFFLSFLAFIFSGISRLDRVQTNRERERERERKREKEEN